MGVSPFFIYSFFVIIIQRTIFIIYKNVIRIFDGVD